MLPGSFPGRQRHLLVAHLLPLLPAYLLDKVAEANCPRSPYSLCQLPDLLGHYPVGIAQRHFLDVGL